jgi:Transglutaminase-like superfamily
MSSEEPDPMTRLRRFLSLPTARQILLVEAFWTVAMNRALLSMFPARAIRERAPKSRRRSAMSMHQLEEIADAVRTAARYVPGATCLTQALAVQSLLTRYGHASSMHIGVEKEHGQPLGAHAWVQCGDRILIGGDENERYAQLLVREERP